MTDTKPTVKQRVYEILESSNPDDFLSNLDDWGVSLLIILDVSAFILGTSKTASVKFNIFWIDIEVISVVVFTILYVLQLWSCTSDFRYMHPVWGRLNYAITPLALIGLLAILPFYLLLISPHMKIIESTDLFRLLRLLKLIR
jgi:voltage-gated potassium channel